MRILLSSLFTLSMALLVGCTDQTVESTASAKPVNDHCPIMGGDVTAAGGTIDWNGKTVGFCCPQCIDKWKALSDEEKAEALAHAGEEDSEHDHDGHSHEDQNGDENPEAETSGEAS